MKYRLVYGNRAAAVPLDAVSVPADALSLRLLILLCSDPSLLDPDACIQKLCQLLSCEEPALREAIGFWKGVGLLEADTSNPDEAKASVATEQNPKKDAPEKDSVPSRLQLRQEAPTYSGEQLAGLLENEENGLRHLIDECQEVMGKILTPQEVGRIAGLFDYLGLETEQILAMFVYYKKKFDEKEKRLSVPYIEKTAYALYEDGIDSAEKFDAFIRETEARNSLQNRLRKLFGIGDRAFSKKEASMIKLWTEELSMPYEMIEQAFEITVNNIGDANFSYMTKIMTSWFNGGITTPEQVAKAEEAFKAQKEKDGNDPGGSSFDTDDFFEQALKRSYEEMKKHSS